MAGPTIALRDVAVDLGGLRILSGVSLDFTPGSIHCVVGPNGGGKTTLVRAVLGQMPFEGRITLDASGPCVIGYVPQSLDIDRSMPLTVLDVLAVMNQRRPAFLGRSRSTRQAEDAALAKVEMTRRADRLFGVLSGGERQRVLFAQALIPPPDLLVMDEPTASMDADGERLVERATRELAAGGTTVLWVNHDWAQVRRIADTVTIVNRGLAVRGSADDLMVREPALPGEAA